jgi:predicted DsbA family dithiol-disulfide isomerase
VPPERITGAGAGAAAVAPVGRAITGVPHFMFNQRLAVSGARDADTLVAAMRRAMLAPATTGSA